MLNIKKNFNLLEFNTLKLNSSAEAWAKITCINEIPYLINYSKKNNLQITPIGDGSNVLLRPVVKKLLVDIQIKGINVIGEDDKTTLIEVCAGENWHDWVCFASKKSWHGLENLALIPGRVGAAPIQNIGAYGVEVSDFIESVTYVDLLKSTKNEMFISRLSNDECNFSYRNSNFKKLKNSIIITSVTFRLNNEFKPNLSYPSINKFFSNSNTFKSIELIKLIIKIRKEKLPDPSIFPNVGSFFKNIELSNEEFELFIKKNLDAPYFKSGSVFKIPAAWLIDECGYRGKKYKSLSMHEKQALVMINNFNNSELKFSKNINLEDVIYFSNEIKNAVKKRFNLNLDIEPELIS